MFTVSMSADTPGFERPLAGIFELGSFWPSTNTASRFTSQRLEGKKIKIKPQSDPRKLCTCQPTQHSQRVDLSRKQRQQQTQLDRISKIDSCPKIRSRGYLLRRERWGIQAALGGGVQLHGNPCQRRVIHAVRQPPDRQRAVLAANIDRIALQRDLRSAPRVSTAR